MRGGAERGKAHKGAERKKKLHIASCALASHDSCALRDETCSRPIEFASGRAPTATTAQVDKPPAMPNYALRDLASRHRRD